MARPSFQTTMIGVICFLLVVIAALEAQRAKNAEDCSSRPIVTVPTR